jgi:hypothetical protein
MIIYLLEMEYEFILSSKTLIYLCILSKNKT